MPYYEISKPEKDAVNARQERSPGGRETCQYHEIQSEDAHEKSIHAQCKDRTESAVAAKSAVTRARGAGNGLPQKGGTGGRLPIPLFVDGRRAKSRGVQTPQPNDRPSSRRLPSHHRHAPLHDRGNSRTGSHRPRAEVLRRQDLATTRTIADRSAGDAGSKSKQRVVPRAHSPSPHCPYNGKGRSVARR